MTEDMNNCKIEEISAYWISSIVGPFKYRISNGNGTNKEYLAKSGHDIYEILDGLAPGENVFLNEDTIVVDTSSTTINNTYF